MNLDTLNILITISLPDHSMITTHITMTVLPTVTSDSPLFIPNTISTMHLTQYYVARVVSLFVP